MLQCRILINTQQDVRCKKSLPLSIFFSRNNMTIESLSNKNSPRYTIGNVISGFQKSQPWQLDLHVCYTQCSPVTFNSSPPPSHPKYSGIVSTASRLSAHSNPLKKQCKTNCNCKCIHVCKM